MISLCSTFFIALFIFELAKVGNSYTVPCRTLSSVHKSTTSIATNIYYEGHIWQHMGDLNEIPSYAYSGHTQSGKTLFLSETDFKKAWNNWRKLSYSTPQNCDSYAKSYAKVSDCVNAADIGIFNARECTSKHDRICTRSKHITPRSVHFVYKKSWWNYWFLLTAYPAANSCK